MSMLSDIFLLFLVVNAIFWGLAPHSSHCNFLSMLAPKMKCPPHWVHLLMGVGFFLGAIALAQEKYLF